MLVYQRVGSMVLLNIWCHMDPIKKYPSHVSINIPAPAGSVMGLIINPPWPLTCNLTIWHSQWHIKIYKVNPPDSSHLQSLCVVTIPIINFGGMRSDVYPYSHQQIRSGLCCPAPSITCCWSVFHNLLQYTVYWYFLFYLHWCLQQLEWWWNN